MDRWRRTLLLLLPSMLLVGCAQKIDQQAQRLGLNKRVVNSGQQVTATVGDGVWYLLAPGANPPAVTKVEGLDQWGKVLHTLPITGP